MITPWSWPWVTSKQAVQRMQVLSPFLFSVAPIVHIEDVYEYLTRVGVRHSYNTDTHNYIQPFSFSQIMINVYMLLSVVFSVCVQCLYLLRVSMLQNSYFPTCLYVYSLVFLLAYALLLFA